MNDFDLVLVKLQKYRDPKQQAKFFLALLEQRPNYLALQGWRKVAQSCFEILRDERQATRKLKVCSNYECGIPHRSELDSLCPSCKRDEIIKRVAK